jgi:hypothetical protein
VTCIYINAPSAASNVFAMLVLKKCIRTEINNQQSEELTTFMNKCSWRFRPLLVRTCTSSCRGGQWLRSSSIADGRCPRIMFLDWKLPSLSIPHFRSKQAFFAEWIFVGYPLVCSEVTRTSRGILQGSTYIRKQKFLGKFVLIMLHSNGRGPSILYPGYDREKHHKSYTPNSSSSSYIYYYLIYQ